MILIVIWLSVVLFLSVIPVRGPETGYPLDKLIHFVLYGITAIIFYRVLRLRTSLIKSTVLSIIIASFFGLAMELLQSVVPWRESSFLDELANIGGAFFFCILYALREYRRKKL